METGAIHDVNATRFEVNEHAFTIRKSSFLAGCSHLAVELIGMRAHPHNGSGIMRSRSHTARAAIKPAVFPTTDLAMVRLTDCYAPTNTELDTDTFRCVGVRMQDYT